MRRIIEQIRKERYDIEYNGDTGEKYDVLLYEYPKISLAKRNYQMYTVPGRNGELVSFADYLGNASISCTFSVWSEEFVKSIRELRRWLSGTGTLKLSDSPEIFYEVLKIEYGDVEREIRTFGQFSVDFLCYPYEFRTDGQMPTESIRYNPYELCMPLYEIIGEGMCHLVVNGKVVKANVGQKLYIDSRKMIAYRKDGELQNTSITGDYEDLWLSGGNCDVTVTPDFSLNIVPRWGYWL